MRFLALLGMTVIGKLLRTLVLVRTFAWILICDVYDKTVFGETKHEGEKVWCNKVVFEIAQKSSV
ncbi:MAG: hypothetical protein CV087_08485 [Candidatus Brocadia sp. WS118]|nr:MAG: hypothetical protein CV087_08485 [Candidatus Brocadia sp. WS118]